MPIMKVDKASRWSRNVMVTPILEYYTYILRYLEL